MLVSMIIMKKLGLILREFYYDKEIFLDDVTTFTEDNLVEIY